MSTRSLAAVGLALFMVGSSVAMTGCYIDDPPPPQYAYGYEPQYYDGYVVYYDDVGRPYYHAEGAIYWVPAQSPYYYRLHEHWRVYGGGYRRWNASYGPRYHGYRHHR